jgi:hypothetical protein
MLPTRYVSTGSTQLSRSTAIGEQICTTDRRRPALYQCVDELDDRAAQVRHL